MRLFPIFCDLQGKNVLVVGGGGVALRKVSLLLEAAARVTVGAQTLCSDMARLVEQGKVQYLEGAYCRAWLDGKCLAVAATSVREVNARIAQDAAALNLWVNVVDDPELSSFHVPAIVDRSPVVIAISSSGVAPVLARRLREKLESLLDQGWGSLAQLAEKYRTRIRERFGDVSERRRFYAWMLDGPVAAHVRQARVPQAEGALMQALAAGNTFSGGLVSFVCAGCADPGLLTLKGLRALNEADVVLYEQGVGDDVLALARRDADKREVAGASVSQNESLCTQMRALAQEGSHVVCVFGAGSRAEQAALMSRLLSLEICCEWIPGVAAGADSFGQRFAVKAVG
ncbi:NAD(P)-dependent oxidoreductase [Paralcaligenes ureilyticus]|uniref:precorrin-2 dehydrogenase n=1 Tax=Paralcaligenes ureilyticus TaxID=627131 RepID=A0A4R3LU88_9BURK|nr:NAD(P)-dependent oxidoreductase [Paralcaligenes ureilyticus]TCT04074.1 precorrin-2 dehydrogenase [Paralcaligenes ureilyticus]